MFDPPNANKAFLEVVTSAQLAEGHRFTLTELSGREEMSGLYRFDLELVLQVDDGGQPQVPDVEELRELLDATWTVRFGDPIEPREVRGVLSQIESAGQTDGSALVFLASLRAPLDRARLTRRSAVHTDVSLQALAERIAGEVALAGVEPAVQIDAGSLSGLAADGFTRLQYREADFDFLARHLANQGVFFYFRDGDAGLELVLSNDASAYTRIGEAGGRTTIVHRNSLIGDSARTVAERVIVAPHAVQLDAFDTARCGLTVTSQASDLPGRDLRGSFGTSLEHDEPWLVRADRAEGANEVALFGQRRYLARAGRSHVVEAFTDVEQLFPGVEITLDDPLGGASGDYVVTLVEHRASSGGYVNRVELLDIAEPFAPPPPVIPRIAGFLRGYIADETDEPLTSGLQLDGRYRVVLASFELGRRELADLELVQVLTGENTGAHFPLHPGTQVTVVFEEGDPDRPLIGGAYPDALTRPPGEEVAATHDFVRSAGGIVIELEDIARGSD